MTDASKPKTATAEAASDKGSSPPKFTAEHAKATGTWLKSFGKTAVSMHPLWLMGEAVTGKKVGGTFKENSQELILASTQLKELISVSSSDIVIIVNEKFKSGQQDTQKTADVIKQAGENAIVVVSQHIEKAQEQLKASSPAIRKAIKRNGKEVVIVVDKTLKNPLVITGISKFAKSRGIPYSEALISVASLALSKVLAALDEEVTATIEEIEEIDAEVLQRRSSKEADTEAKKVGKDTEDKKGYCCIS